MTAPHPLVSLVYCSSATHTFGERELAELLAVSRERNSARDITGMLLYRGGEFVQILEGPRSDVEALMQAIGRDPRHTDVRVLLEEPLHERRFDEWTMGYQSLVAPEPGMASGYRDSFDDLRIGDHDMIGRAIMELTLWFRVRESAGRERAGTEAE
ncbi:BLUF domain-containing protein [Microbacterium sp. ISL-103]|uniref:BLUF domain-containing protein n=1 Tax=Microbacterium sp. ISL-103 TaxID=2819156 RepID=UPI001BEA105B|nr:BLUF domain-containing protein [Microbacterium sp. ISL-103]MBT2476194.1 BLUF domain-containing protein [Microbacterium sp. ISL-103]